MIPWVEAYAREKWLHWTGHRVGRLRCALLIGSFYRHQRATLIFGNSLRRPEIVAKIAWAEPSRHAIEKEHENLVLAHSHLPKRLVCSLPNPLDLIVSESAVAMFSRVIPGRRPIVPRLLSPPDSLAKTAVERYLGTTLEWTLGLSRATRVVHLTNGEQFAKIERAYPNRDSSWWADGIPSYRCWQHGDPAPGNLLITRKHANLVDWEHASPESLPWHDSAYLALVLAFIAARQSNLPTTQAFDALYDPSSWCGDIIRGQLANSWSFNTSVAVAVAITSMQLAIDRQENAAWSELARHLLAGKGPKWLQA